MMMAALTIGRSAPQAGKNKRPRARGLLITSRSLHYLFFFFFAVFRFFVTFFFFFAIDPLLVVELHSPTWPKV